MSFRVVPCEPGNLHICCSIKAQAFAANPLFSLIYPNGGTEALQKSFTYHSLLEYDSPDIHMYCVVDALDRDKLIAYAKWAVVNGQPRDDGGTGSVSGDGTLPVVSSKAPHVPPEDTYDPLFQHFLSEATPIRKAHLTTQTIVLDDLSVKPEHQWHGAGKLLLRTLIDFADKKCLPCYIESTPGAYNMYTHQGFREVDKLDIDLGQWKQGYGVYRTSMLYRDPKENPT